MSETLTRLVKQFGQNKQHALVIGDVMLDRYMIGEVNRISPEAPVPVVLVKQQNERAGGAANVAANLALLGIKTDIIGAIGQDAEGKSLLNCMQGAGINTEYMLTSVDRPTISKTRIMGGHQQMLRLDQENNTSLNQAEQQLFAQAFGAAMRSKPAIVVLSDYDKGLLTPLNCQMIIQHCRQQGIPVLVDPKGKDYEKYRQATALTPNKKETAEACQTQSTDPNLIEKATKLKQDLALDFLAVTRGEEGITLIQNEVHHLNASAKQVFDVSGAGDTVIATLAASLMHGMDPLNSLALANTAAGVVVGKVGTVPITQQDLMHALSNEQSQEQAQKICSLTELMEKVSKWRQSGQKIVFTNGCFDLLHAGHVTYLEKAKKRGDKLILGLNTDRSVRSLKGPNRPVVHENDRARVLSALESVNAVILFDDDTPLHLIQAIRPDIIAKGSDYSADQVVGGKEVLSWGGEIALIDLVEGRSTTSMINKMNA